MCSTRAVTLKAHVVSQEQHTAFQEWVLRYGKAAAIDLFTGVMSKTLCEQQAASILNPVLPYFLSKPSSFYDDQSDFFSNPGTTTQATESKPEESLAKRMRNEVKDEVVPQAASDQVTALMLSPG